MSEHDVNLKKESGLSLSIFKDGAEIWEQDIDELGIDESLLIEMAYTVFDENPFLGAKIFLKLSDIKGKDRRRYKAIVKKAICDECMAEHGGKCPTPAVRRAEMTTSVADLAKGVNVQTDEISAVYKNTHGPKDPCTNEPTQTVIEIKSHDEVRK